MGVNYQFLSELESQMVRTFKKYGWNCVTTSQMNSSRFDITLLYNNESVGAVEIFYIREPNSRNINHMLIDKMNRLKYFFAKNNTIPKYLVLTDGRMFFNYINGELFSTTSFPLSPIEFNSLYESSVNNGQKAGK